jgi:hypothetical protein
MAVAASLPDGSQAPLGALYLVLGALGVLLLGWATLPRRRRDGG